MSAGNPMRLALSQYLRTLRERDEFDRLLPELLTEMGYLPLVKPKAGVRQFGVDFPAAGRSPGDRIDELLLFVIKQGDIGRRTWDGDQNAVRQSMDEIIDVYLDSHVPPAYQGHRKVIIVATTGDLGQEVQPNWAGFATKHPELRFEFWGADKVAELIETYLLNEHLFDAQDRSDLRKSLVMAADSDYRFNDLCRMILRQLGLDSMGQLTEAGVAQNTTNLIKALRRVHLAALICAYWADNEGERRQALWILERTVLWAFHRALLQNLQEQSDVLRSILDIWHSYGHAAQRYYDRIVGHVRLKDGLSGYCREGAEYAVMLFEQVGLLATVGLAKTVTSADEPEGSRFAENAEVVADALASLLRNHPAAASPRLDNQVIDVCLALVLFTLTRRFDAAHWWLAELAGRLNFVFMLGRLFPVGTDSFDDLVESEDGADEDFKEILKQTSWLLATIASWCAMLDLDSAYTILAEGHAKEYPTVGAQLWHPSLDWSSKWYFGPGHQNQGSSEAPYPLPLTAQELRERIAKFNEGGRLRWEENSPALQVGLWALDFVACRHFRTPVPASMWYQLKDRSHHDEVVPNIPPEEEPH